jgi:hypothetical protein
MAYVGIIPVAYDVAKSEYRILLGREHPEQGWNDQLRWAHFAGGSEPADVSMLAGAAREGYEESMGFLGSLEEITSNLSDKSVVRMKGVYAYLLLIEYNPNLPELYHNVHSYLSRCTRPHPRKTGYNYLPTCPNGYYEKVEIGWFSARSLFNLTNNKWDPKDGKRPELRHGFEHILREMFRAYKFL